jgi:hypothetical protein
LDSNLITKWTAIITNIAVVVGLGFVGLEFRNNTRAFESERIDSFTQGSLDIQRMSVGDSELSDILLKSYSAPDSLTKTELDRAQHWLTLNYSNFRRIHTAYLTGLIPTHIYEMERAGVGFNFASDIGIGVINIFLSSNELDNETWEVLKESAEQARAYCKVSENICMERYEPLKNQ